MTSVKPPNEEEVKKSWIRLLSLPRKVNPALDMTGVNCQVGQPSERLWFLQSTLGGSASRTCTIPAGRDIVCNVLSCELSDPELPGEKYADLEKRAREAFDNTNKILNFEVDGKKVGISEADWENAGYRITTSISEIGLPDNNLFEVHTGLTRFAADGYYVKLTGLEPGRHTLFFGGAILGKDKQPVFETAVHYNLTQL